MRVWRIVLVFTLIVGVLFWEVRHLRQGTSASSEKSIAKPSMAAIEKDIGKKGIQPGSPAPDFELENIEGKRTTLLGFKGKTVILNFWATWCPPCKEEMPYIENFYVKNKDKNVVVLAVNLTNQEKNKNSVQQFIKEHNISFPVLLDNDGNTSKLYQNIAIPTTFMVGPDGKINQKIVGPMQKGTLEKFISQAK